MAQISSVGSEIVEVHTDCAVADLKQREYVLLHGSAIWSVEYSEKQCSFKKQNDVRPSATTSSLYHLTFLVFWQVIRLMAHPQISQLPPQARHLVPKVGCPRVGCRRLVRRRAPSLSGRLCGAQTCHFQRLRRRDKHRRARGRRRRSCQQGSHLRPSPGGGDGLVV